MVGASSVHTFSFKVQLSLYSDRGHLQINSVMGTRSGSKDTANYGLIGIYKGSGCQHALIWLNTLLPGMCCAVVASGRGQTREHAGPKLKGLPIGGHSHAGQ